MSRTPYPQQQQQAPTLTPQDLFSQQAKIDAVRLDIYNRILGTVHQKIKATAMLPGCPQMVYFDVPDWQPGCPRFDVKDCILYLVWHLRTAGFQVMYVSPNRLLINWQAQSIQYYQEESPIRQAMIAATAPTAAAAASATPALKPAIKKASSYKPMPGGNGGGIADMLAGGSGSKRGGSSTITFI